MTLLTGVLDGAAPTASAQPDSALPAHVRLPRDEAAHRAPTEWWYFNGHLSAVDPQGHRHRYGFEYVTFKFEGGPQPVYVANLAVTDLTRHRFTYSARVDSYPRPDNLDSFAVHTAGWIMRGAGGVNTLRAALPGYSVRLRTSPAGPAVLHGDDGVIPFAPFGRSAYYSWPSLRAGGTLVDHGVTLRVSGISWMDHQWGPFGFRSGGGWDWFSVALHDGRRYMLYFLRDASGEIVGSVGTQVAADGGTVHLSASTFAVQATGAWTSSVTGIRYSSGWRLDVPGGQLMVRPRLRDQEVDVRDVQGVAYWEGDVAVRGVVDGRPVYGDGYTEINPAGQP